MKKTFQLHIENKNSSRVLEKIKNEIRKYIKRERNKKLPPNVDYWLFKCKFSKDDDTPKDIDFRDIIQCINDASISNAQSFYMEIISTNGIKEKKDKTKDNTTDTIIKNIQKENKTI